MSESVFNTEKTKDNLSIIIPPKPPFTIKTSQDLFKANLLAIASAKKGNGKSTIINTMVKRYMNAGAFMDVILVTPTYESNKEAFANIIVNDSVNIFDPMNPNVIQEVLDFMKSRKEEYYEYLAKKDLYKKYKKDLSSKQFSLQELYDIYEEYIFDFMNEEPKWYYKNDKEEPRFMIIFDDILGLPLMSQQSRGLVNLIIKMRHVNSGSGCSICMLVQQYSSQQGLPKTIRNNTNVLMLGGNTDTQQLIKIHQEHFNDREVSFETFMSIFEYATNEPFSFLVIDFYPKQKNKFLRKNLDEYIILKDFKK